MMLEKMFDILEQEKMCVLATEHGGKPHCSLMAYVFDRQGKALVMVTGRDTTKFKNMSANGNVSLLVDTRKSVAGEERGQTKALTVSGMFEPQDPRDLIELKQKFVLTHPHLKDLVDQDESEFFRVHISSLLLLDGPVDAHFVELE